MQTREVPKNGHAEATSATAGAPGMEAVLARMDAMQEQIAYLVRRQQKQEELFAEMTPIAKEILATATERFGELEKEGAIAFAKELLLVTRKVIQHYGPEDVRQFGDAVVKILDTVRAMTQPEVLAILDQAGVVLQQADTAEPIGILGMVKASRNEDVQKGMAVMMDLLRHVGHAAKTMAERKTESDDRKARLAKVLGPKRPKKSLGTERTPPPSAAREWAKKEVADMGPPTAACEPPKPEAAEVVMDGVGFTKEGHLADPKAWTRDLAVTIAEAQGVQLDDTRWKIIEFARADFEAHGASPNVRRITMGTGIATKELYAMFPKAPARTVAKIAGIPKPAGCI